MNYVRTDLAIEKTIEKEEIKINNSGIIVTKSMDDKYLFYTLDLSKLNNYEEENQDNCIIVLARIIKETMKHLKLTKDSKGLIVGLGNVNVTPDSLGPHISENVIVTRHLFLIDPNAIKKGVQEISSIAPGVMGTTGIETYDIILSIVKKIKCDYVIVCDALKSRSIERVNKTIQVSTKGITPGSGVGNKRKEVSQKTLGIPVIAIGVPTVCDFATITSDVIDTLINEYNVISKDESTFLKLDNIEKKELIEKILSLNGMNMIVTPKDCDQDINILSRIISRGINRAIHPIMDITYES